MPGVSWELQKAIHAVLAADVGITTLLGGPKIFDDVPRGAELPYVTIGKSVVRDWSTGTEDGHEHLLTISVWSRANGEREVHHMTAAIEAVLKDANLSLPAARLINLRLEFFEVRRESDGETARGIMRFRATTEPTD